MAGPQEVLAHTNFIRGIWTRLLQKGSLSLPGGDLPEHQCRVTTQKGRGQGSSIGERGFMYLGNAAPRQVGKFVSESSEGQQRPGVSYHPGVSLMYG